MAGPRKRQLTNAQKGHFHNIKRAAKRNRNAQAMFDEAVRRALAGGLSLNEAAEAAGFKTNTPIRTIRDKAN